MTTKSSLHTGASTVEDQWHDEDDVSEHNFDSDHATRRTTHDYLSTSLVAGRNITLADVVVEETPVQVIQERLKLHAARVRFRFNSHGIVDPRAELKARKKR